MYTNQTDLIKLKTLMFDILEKKVSRNRNFYTFLQQGEYRRFKRAKLLLSLLKDLGRTESIPGFRVTTERSSGQVKLSLHDPSLHYRRQIFLSEGELDLIQQYVDLTLYKPKVAKLTF